MWPFYLTFMTMYLLKVQSQGSIIMIIENSVDKKCTYLRKELLAIFLLYAEHRNSSGKKLKCIVIRNLNVWV